MSTAKGREVNIGKAGQGIRKRVWHVPGSKMSSFSSAFISYCSNCLPSFDYSLWSCDLDLVLHDADWTPYNDQHMKNVSCLPNNRISKFSILSFYC